ncbi:MAG TPA: hypothetical protein VNE21_05110 [Mycobacteriales bacterium]|nr:hypothetical protein [Mycobacteriales bacterium]
MRDGDDPGVAQDRSGEQARVSPEELVAAAKEPVGRLGGAFMLDAECRQRGLDLGYSAWPYYYGGRGGVLGDVDPDVVAAAFVFFAPEVVRKAWERARAVAAPQQTARQFLTGCHEWGRRKFAGVAGLEEFCLLAERVATQVSPAGVPLFAAWRAEPLPDDPAARAAQLLHVLREHRGGLHGIAVLAAGLTPLEAVVAGPHGRDNARWFAWPEPYPEPEPLAQRRASAEQRTDDLVCPAYAALDEEARQAFAGHLAALGAAAG